MLHTCSAVEPDPWFSPTPFPALILLFETESQCTPGSPGIPCFRILSAESMLVDHTQLIYFLFSSTLYVYLCLELIM